MEVVDLLRRALQRLDRRKVDRANVRRDHAEHSDDEQPAEQRLRASRACHSRIINVGSVLDRNGAHSSMVNGNARVHAVRNTMSYAPSSLSIGHASAAGRPASSVAVACAAPYTTGTKNGRLSMGSSSSASRVLAAIALNKV